MQASSTPDTGYVSDHAVAHYDCGKMCFQFAAATPKAGRKRVNNGIWLMGGSLSSVQRLDL
jgi:hypothetical protein